MHTLIKPIPRHITPLHEWCIHHQNPPLIGVKVSKWDDYDATACKIRSYMRRSG